MFRKLLWNTFLNLEESKIMKKLHAIASLACLFGASSLSAAESSLKLE
jgi:hypothetical protein